MTHGDSITKVADGFDTIATSGDIVAAIADRDGEMAELLMRHHIRTTRANAMRCIAEREVAVAN